MSFFVQITRLPAVLTGFLTSARPTLHQCWATVRQLSGDDAYERYVQHVAQHHADAPEPPLSKAEFFKQWQDRQWRGVKRCC